MGACLCQNRCIPSSPACSTCQLAKGQFPFPVKLEYSVSARKRKRRKKSLPPAPPQVDWLRVRGKKVEWLRVRGKRFPDALLRYVPEKARSDLQDRQFYMKQSYQDPTDADGAYYTKIRLPTIHCLPRPTLIPTRNAFPPRAAENCMVRILF